MDKKLRKQNDLKPLPEFDIFQIPKIQNSIDCEFTQELRPVSTLDSKAFIEFNLTTAKDQYLRLWQTEFYLRLKIRLEKSAIGPKIVEKDWDDVWTCTNLMNSLLKQVEFYIGDRLIDPPHQTHAYKTYFEKFFGKSSDIKNTAAELGFWFEGSNFSNPDGSISKSSEIIRCKAGAKDAGEGEEFELFGKIHLPMFEQRKTALIGGCKLKLRFIPNDPAFYIKCKNDVRVKSVEFTNCTLKVEGVKVMDHILRGHELGLNHSNARYLLLENFVVPVTVNKGTQDIIIDNIHTGAMPNRCFIAFVDHRAFNGSHSMNPYNFQNFGVNHLQLFANGLPIGGLAKKPNFRSGWITREYYDLFKVTNQDNVDTCITLKKDNFAKGNNIFAFRCMPDLSTAKALNFQNPLKEATIRLHLTFDEALTETITVLVYLDFDAVLEITGERNVFHELN